MKKAFLYLIFFLTPFCCYSSISVESLMPIRYYIDFQREHEKMAAVCNMLEKSKDELEKATLRTVLKVELTCLLDRVDRRIEDATEGMSQIDSIFEDLPKEKREEMRLDAQKYIQQYQEHSIEIERLINLL